MDTFTERCKINQKIASPRHGGARYDGINHKDPLLYVHNRNIAIPNLAGIYNRQLVHNQSRVETLRKEISC